MSCTCTTALPDSCMEGDGAAFAPEVVMSCWDVRGMWAEWRTLEEECYGSKLSPPFIFSPDITFCVGS